MRNCMRNYAFARASHVLRVVYASVILLQWREQNCGMEGPKLYKLVCFARFTCSFARQPVSSTLRCDPAPVSERGRPEVELRVEKSSCPRSRSFSTMAFLAMLHVRATMLCLLALFMRPPVAGAVRVAIMPGKSLAASTVPLGSLSVIPHDGKTQIVL